MHAFIIEDEPLIAIAIEDVLRDNGFTSFGFATSADEAVEAAKDQCPDLITSDVALKPGNGIDAIFAICGRALVPVIFITSNGAEVRERLPDYLILSKPFLVSNLTRAVQTVVSRNLPVGSQGDPALEQARSINSRPA